MHAKQTYAKTHYVTSLYIYPSNRKPKLALQTPPHLILTFSKLHKGKHHLKVSIIMEGEKSLQMASSISRWSPTKEQISVLEDLYRAGLQTPSTDQIQQIASNLRAYGHIEGRNVFYWFQNHKARLRQRQRQEPRFYMSRLVRNRPKVPILPASTTNTSTCPDVLGNALCFPQSAIGFYTQLPAAKFPEEVSEITKISQRTVGLPFPYEYLDPIDGVSDANQYGQADDTNELQTLELFPLHPTGILGERSEMSSPSSVITSSPLSSETTIQDFV